MSEFGGYVQILGIGFSVGVSFGDDGTTRVTVGASAQGSAIVAAQTQGGAAIWFNGYAGPNYYNPFAENFDFPYVDFSRTGNTYLGLGTLTAAPGVSGTLMTSPIDGTIYGSIGGGVTDLIEVGGYEIVPGPYRYDKNSQSWVSTTEPSAGSGRGIIDPTSAYRNDYNSPGYEPRIGPDPFNSPNPAESRYQNPLLDPTNTELRNYQPPTPYNPYTDPTNTELRNYRRKGDASL
jgi:hypothetical protein